MINRSRGVTHSAVGHEHEILFHLCQIDSGESVHGDYDRMPVIVRDKPETGQLSRQHPLFDRAGPSALDTDLERDCSLEHEPDRSCRIREHIDQCCNRLDAYAHSDPSSRPGNFPRFCSGARINQIFRQDHAGAPIGPYVQFRVYVPIDADGNRFAEQTVSRRRSAADRRTG